MNEPQAIMCLESFIGTVCPDSWGKVHLYTWSLYEAGPRVAEVSWFHRNKDGTGYGSSAMQTDGEESSSALCFAIERLMLELMYGEKIWNGDNDARVDGLLDAIAVLRCYLLGETNE